VPPVLQAQPAPPVGDVPPTPGLPSPEDARPQ
jgi:hypothetical protein